MVDFFVKFSICFSLLIILEKFLFLLGRRYVNVSIGAKVWFEVESESLEIFIEKFRGRLGCRVLERGRGFSSWIKFREKC